MADSQILSLFGTPSQARALDRQRLATESQMYSDPIARQMYQSAGQVAGGIGSLFGLETSGVRRAEATQDAMKDVTSDVGTAQYYYDLAEQFRQRGMLQSAVVAADKAKQIEEDLMDKATAKYGSISFVQYGSQATNIRRLIMQIERTSDPAIKAALQAQLEEAFRKGASEVAQREAQEAGEVEAAKKAEERYNSDLKSIQEQFNQATANARSVYTIRTNIINKIKDINTGFGSSAITGFQEFARALGLVESDDRWSVLSSNTQAAQSIIGQLMLEQIKTLGTNPSNADREFLMKTLPDMSLNPKAIENIAKFMEEKAKFLKADAKAKIEHLKKHKSLVDPPYESPVWDALEKLYASAKVSSSRTPLTDEDLIDAPAPLKEVQPASPPAPEVQPEPAPAPTVQPEPQPESIIPPAPPRTEEQTEVAQNVIPEGLREPADTAEGVATQISELRMRLQGDLTPAEQAALGGQISRLGNARRQLEEQEAQTFTTAVDAIVTSAFPTSFGAEQRLANMTRKQKLEYAYRVLTLKMNSGREMSQVEMKVLKQIINELQAGL